MTDPRYDALRAAIGAIERLENVVRLLLASKPVRDVPETYGEAAWAKKLLTEAIRAAPPSSEAVAYAVRNSEGKVHSFTTTRELAERTARQLNQSFTPLYAQNDTGRSHDVSFEKWLSYQPFLEDHGGSIPITRDKMYLADTVRAAWEAGKAVRSETAQPPASEAGMPRHLFIRVKELCAGRVTATTYPYPGAVKYIPDPYTYCCPRCGAKTAEACNDKGCFFLESGAELTADGGNTKLPGDDEIAALFRKRDMLENPLSADEVDEEIDRLLRKQFALRTNRCSVNEEGDKR